MNSGQMVFSQLMDFVPKYEFRKCVERHRGNYRTRSFSCNDQFLCMVFAQLTFRESLRDIEICLRALQDKLYHVGIRGNIARSTLAKANENRDWQIYADFAQTLIAQARALYVNDPFEVALEQSAYAFDSTTIDLCLTLFPWGQFRRHKAAIKVHTLMDLRASIPSFIRITGGQVHDVNLLDELLLEPGAFYVMDRAYIDFQRLHRFTEQSSYFIVRAKSNLDYTRRSSRKVDKTTGLRSDQTIMLRGPKSSQFYPQPLRRISYVDLETKTRYVFLTNNFQIPALVITQLYHYRWQIELFFKWIKQHLRIKAFYGTSVNAVKTQVWIAIIVYVLVAIVKKQLNVERSMGEILQILSLTLFEKIPISQALSMNTKPTFDTDPPNQLKLFDF